MFALDYNCRLSEAPEVGLAISDKDSVLMMGSPELEVFDIIEP